jgi:hypothetical protein
VFLCSRSVLCASIDSKSHNRLLSGCRSAGLPQVLGSRERPSVARSISSMICGHDSRQPLRRPSRGILLFSWCRAGTRVATARKTQAKPDFLGLGMRWDGNGIRALRCKDHEVGISRARGKCECGSPRPLRGIYLLIAEDTTPPLIHLVISPVVLLASYPSPIRSDIQ